MMKYQGWQTWNGQKGKAVMKNVRTSSKFHTADEAMDIDTIRSTGVQDMTTISTSGKSSQRRA